jgi:hypothetical protein
MVLLPNPLPTRGTTNNQPIPDLSTNNHTFAQGSKNSEYGFLSRVLSPSFIYYKKFFIYTAKPHRVLSAEHPSTRATKHPSHQAKTIWLSTQPT